MALATRDLVRITIDTPQRRLDVAVPSNVPVADLLLAFVRAGGERLADAASGWVVRRADGTLLSTSETLDHQGVRDGALLHLVSAEMTWPEFEYDDIADAIASMRTRDRVWSPAATRWAGATGGVTALLIGLVALLRDGTRGDAAVIAAGIALILLAAGAVLARVRGDAWSGAVIASIAPLYAAVAGAYASGHAIDAQDLLIGFVVAAVTGGIALATVGRAAEPIIAVLASSLVGVVAAGFGRVTTRVDAGAIVLGLSVLAAGLIPAAAVRIGGLSRWYADGGPDALAEAVARTESIVTGLLGAAAIVALVTGSILAYAGGDWARVLAATGAIVFALRARDYGSIRQRLLALLAGVAPVLPIAAWALMRDAIPLGTATGAVLIGLVTISLSSGRPATPTLGRIADGLQTLGILAIVPLACGVLGLYAKARGLH